MERGRSNNIVTHIEENIDDNNSADIELENSASVGGSIAALALLESLRRGNTIEIPALGIKLSRKRILNNKEESPDPRDSQ